MTAEGLDFLGTEIESASLEAIKKIFSGPFDDKAWTTWLEDGAQSRFLNQDVYPVEKIICVARYGNKSVTIWQYRDGVKTPVCSFLPGLHGLGKKQALQSVCIKAEAEMRTKTFVHMRSPKLVTGFLRQEAPDVEDLNLEVLSAMARTDSPDKLHAAYQTMLDAQQGDYVFINNELLPPDFMVGEDNPQCLDFSGLIDPETRLFKTQYGFQHQLNRLGMGYSLAKEARLIKKIS